MKIFDSASRGKVEFCEIEKGKVRIYLCGPTVYDHSHIGHARSAVCFDILLRLFKAIGYETLFVRNFTDIDDKIIARCISCNESIDSVTNRFIESYLQDMSALNVLTPDVQPRVTDFLGEISSFIQGLLDKGMAYKLEDGDIYLDVSKDSRYGTLSHSSAEPLFSRIDNSRKKDARDFALWKAYKGSHDVGYDSILGRGRPGWHIECSAIVDSVLAYKSGKYSIDIHAGGSDLLFPHHENEACQIRSYRGMEIAKYWMHNGFVSINGDKMSKSLGNSFLIKEVLKRHHGEVLRNYLLGTHYRATLHFSEEDLLASKKRLDRIYRLKRQLSFDRDIDVYVHGSSAEYSEESRFKCEFLSAMKDDLNVSLALSVIDHFTKYSNDLLDRRPNDDNLKLRLKFDLAFFDYVLGLGQLSHVDYFQLGVDSATKAKILSSIEKRAALKSSGDYDGADRIRDALAAEGIALMDRPGNTTDWEKTD